MKMALFLCALVLSLHGWCASLAPSQPAARGIDPGYNTVENVKLEGVPNSPVLLEKMQIVMIVCGLLTYLAVISWWAFSTKSSLDKILKNVLQDMARYPS